MTYAVRVLGLVVLALGLLVALAPGLLLGLLVLAPGLLRGLLVRALLGIAAATRRPSLVARTRSKPPTTPSLVTAGRLCSPPGRPPPFARRFRSTVSWRRSS